MRSSLLASLVSIASACSSHTSEVAREASPTPVSPAPAPVVPHLPALPRLVDVAVVDLAGQPIAQAEVTSAGEPRPTLTTGTWRLPAGTQIVVTAPGFAAREFVVVEASGTIRVALLPESTIAGRVVDARGRPIAGATVTIPDLRDGVARGVVTDADGRYRIGGLRPGRFTLKAEGERHAGEVALAVGFDEHVTSATIAARPMTVLAGELLDADGAGCTAGRIVLDDARSRVSREIAVRDGQVRVLLPRGHEFALTFACEQHLTGAGAPLVVGDRDIVGQVWRSERGLAIRGRVVDAQGRPVPKARISRGDPEAMEPLVTDTATDGTFMLGGLKAGEWDLEVSATLGGFEFTTATRVMAEADARDVVVRLGPTPTPPGDDAGGDPLTQVYAHARGVVVDAGGAPVAGALVIYAEVGGWRDMWKVLGEALSPVPTRTGSDGAFELVIAEQRRRRCYNDCMQVLIALRPGGGEAVAQLESEGPTRLQLSSRSAIVGRVVDARGRPAPSFGLTFEVGLSPQIVAVDHGDGSFAREGLFAGAYVVWAYRGREQASARVELDAGETERVELVLREPPPDDEAVASDNPYAGVQAIGDDL